jgi:cephalosporin hydroxylase
MTTVELKDLIKHSQRHFYLCQDEDEIFDVCSYLSGKDIKNILEIGVKFGGSFYIWCKFFDEGLKVGVDKVTNYHVEKLKYKRNFLSRTWAKNVSLIDGDSTNPDVVGRVKNIFKHDKVDFLFIDGDHSYDVVKQDYDNYVGLVREGGYIAFHDINSRNTSENMGVPLFWGKLEGRKVEFKRRKKIMGIGIVEKGNTNG